MSHFTRNRVGYYRYIQHVLKVLKYLPDCLFTACNIYDSLHLQHGNLQFLSFMHNRYTIHNKLK